MRKFLPLLLLLSLAGIAGYLVREWHQSAAPPPEPVLLRERPSATVITQIRGLARLEGAQFHMERIIDLSEKQTRLRGLIEAQDSLLLIAVGDVVAGVDLSHLVEADLNTSPDGRQVHLTLPAAQVFSAALDDDKTYVHTRTTDVLATRDEHLESKARQRAVRHLESAAREANILSKAEESVTRTLTSLLTGLGFERVTVSYRHPPSSDQTTSRPSGPTREATTTP